MGPACNLRNPPAPTPKEDGLGQYGPPECGAKGFMSGAADLDDPRLLKVLRPSLQDGYWMYTDPPGGQTGPSARNHSLVQPLLLT